MPNKPDLLTRLRDEFDPRPFQTAQAAANEIERLRAQIAPKPTHTDLMVSPEAIDAFLDANPPPDRRCGTCSLSKIDGLEGHCCPDVVMDLPYWAETMRKVLPHDGENCPVWRAEAVTG